MNSAVKKNIAFLLFGLVIGGLSVFFVIHIMGESTPEPIVETEVQIIKEKVVDTVVVKKKVYIDTLTVIESQNDTLSDFLDDSPHNGLFSEDTLSINSEDEEFVIVSERLVGRKSVSIITVQPDTVDVSKLLERQANSYGTSITVEYWESPLDLIGYELSKSRLKLFGFNSNDPIEISRDYNSESLKVQVGSGSGAFTMVLEKTSRFKTLLIR